jgi:hypothetical protein
LLAFRLSVTVQGSWQAELWNWKPFPWLSSPEFVAYLMICLPGTIAGDRLGGSERDTKPDRRAAAACFSIIPLTLYLLFNHLNPMVAVMVAGAVYWWCRGRLGAPMQDILLWGLLWLTIGCLLEPFQGGIKKDPNTLSYLFATSGLASFGLVSLACTSERWLKPIGLVGQNPLLAYQAVTSLMPSLWGLILAPALVFLPQSVPYGLAVAALQVVLLAGLVSTFTRAKISMRI